MKKLTIQAKLLIPLLCLTLGAVTTAARVDGESADATGQPELTSVVSTDDVRTNGVTPPAAEPVAPVAAPEGIYYSLVWHSINNGGSTELASASYSTGLTVGLPAGELSSASYSGYLGFWQPFGSGGSGCCVGRVGDANGLGGDEPTIGDVSTMIDAKFITGVCEGIIDCLAEADVNQSGLMGPDCGDVTIGDISTLIDYLFITGPALGLPDCL